MRPGAVARWGTVSPGRSQVLDKIQDVDLFNDKLRDLLLTRLNGFLVAELLVGLLSVEELLATVLDTI